MARKSARKSAAVLLPGMGGVTLKVRPLPPTVQGLFLPRLVEEAAGSKSLAPYEAQREAAFDAFAKWAVDLRVGAIANLNESQLEGDFVSKLLKPLGYTTSADVGPGQPWTLMPKWGVPGDGIVDIALGRFESGPSGEPIAEPIVMVELKGAGTDLDRRGSAGRSAVEQGWGYLNACESVRWVIVTNFVELRLYSRSKSYNSVHRVLLDELDSREDFDAFFAIFHADGLLERAHLPQNARTILEKTGERQRDVSEELYEAYREHRVALIDEIRDARPGAGFDAAIHAAQNLLNRVLFIAFAEDRELISDYRTLEHTAASRRPGSTRWRAFQDLFRALDVGDDPVSIPAFNGELFKPDPILDDPGFALGDRWPTFFKSIGDYDFRDEVPVEILGHLFERSITDLEEIRARGLDAYRADLDEARRRKKDPGGRRKREGVYYTDSRITAYLVAAALDPAWEANRDALLARHGLEGDQPPIEDDPDGRPILPEPDPRRAAYVRDRLGWLDGLTVCDPACGSGAFLIAAYNWFEDRRLALLDDLKLAEPDAPEADGDRLDWQRRSAPLILANNLYGVDLSPESAQIARLSLWIRTAHPGQKLSNLARNIACGNSLVDDPAVAGERAFAWADRFPEVFARGGFDAVVGNPPYVRQEWLGKPLKDFLQGRFRAFHGMADLYVYFYELALNVLRPGGRLAYVVTNKWMKSGYGEPLRRLFAERAWIDAVVDFGHAKGFFKEADVFPCFLVARRPTDGPAPETVRACALRREAADLDNLRDLVAGSTVAVERERLGPEAWNLEPKAVGDLLAKIRERGVPLAEYAGSKPYRGIVTGFNEAFCIDTATRDALIQEDPRSAEIIRPYLRGRDIKRWAPEWAGWWMIFARRGVEIERYPVIVRHLESYRTELEPKPDDWVGREWKGRKPGTYKWFEIQDSVEYWELFDDHKIVYQDIGWRPAFGFDRRGSLLNNTGYLVPSNDAWLLAVLNSGLFWWYSWRSAQHGKDEALRFFASYIENAPVCSCPGKDENYFYDSVEAIVRNTEQNHLARAAILDWIRMQYAIDKPNRGLVDPLNCMNSDEFLAAVISSRGKSKSLTSAALAELRREYKETIEPARALAAETRALEARLNDLVNAAYGLTPEEVRLMWDTAPPRMPIERPESAG